MMSVTGQCHCGQVRYRAKIDPAKIVICHCNDCQRLTGCAYRVSVTVPVTDMTMISGEAKPYVKIAESGKKRVQAFCGDCGSPLYSEDLENPQIRALRYGTIDQRAELRPSGQIWFQAALPWAQNISDINPKRDAQT